MAQSYENQYGRNGGFVRCEHRNMVSVYGVFHFMRRCDFCKSHILDILNVVQCTDCGSILHGSCTLKNMLYHVKDIMKHAGATHSRDMTFEDAISIFNSGVFSNNKTTKLEELQASEQHTRIKLPMERAVVTRRDDEVHPRSSPHDSNVQTWRNGPASEINYVRKTPCYGRPQMTGQCTYWRPNGYVQERRQNKKWMPHPPTHVFETNSTATPLSSHQHLPPSTDYTDQYLYGPESSGPVNGPSIGYPVHEAPKFVVLERVQVDSTTGDRISTTRVDEMPKEDTILTSKLDVPKNKVDEPIENFDTSTKVVDKPIEVNALTDKVEAPIKMSDTMTKEVDTSTTEVNYFTTEVDAPNENINALTEKVDTSTTEVNCLTTEVDAPTKKVDALTKKVDESSENVNTSTKVVDTPIEVNVPTKKVEVPMKKSESMTKEVHTSTTEVNCLTTEVDAPNKKVDEPNENINTTTMVVDALIEVNAPIKKIDAPTKMFDTMTKEVNTSTPEVNYFTAEVDAPTKKVEELTENFDISTKVIDEPIEVNTSIEKEDAPIKKADTFNEEVDVLNKNVDVPSGKVNTPNENINAPIKKVDTSTFEVNCFTAEVDAPTKKVDSPTKKVDEPSENVDTSSKVVDVQIEVNAPTKKENNPTKKSDAVTKKVNVLKKNVNIPSGKADAPNKNINTPTKKVKTPIKMVGEPNKKTDEPTKVDTPKTEVNLLTAEVAKLNEKVDSPNKDNTPTKKNDAPNKSLNAPIKKVDVPTKKFDVPTKNVSSQSKKVDELQKKVDAPNNKVNKPIKNVNTPNKKLNASTKEADVRIKKVDATNKKIDAPNKNVKAPTVLSNVVTKMEVDQTVKTVIKVTNEKVEKITVLPNKKSKETVCKQINRRATTSQAELQSDMDGAFEIVRKKMRKEKKSRTSIPPSSNGDMGVSTKNVGALSKKVDELKKKVDAPTEMVDAPNKKVNTSNKKINELTKKVDIRTKKVDASTKKVDEPNKKVDKPNNKVNEPIQKVNTPNKKLNAPTKEAVVRTKKVATTSKNNNVPTVLSNVVTKMDVDQKVKTVTKVTNEKMVTITVPPNNKSKETVCKQINRRTSTSQAESQSDKDGDFEIVQKKVRNEEKSKTCISSSSNSDTGVTRPCAYSDVLKNKNITTSLGPGTINKTKVEHLKETVPQTVFILKTTPERAAAAKMALRKEIKEKLKTPLFKSCRLLEGGDLELVSADGPTLIAMRDIMALRKDIVEPKSRWPMIMLYGVDKDLSTEEIARKIANLNKKLGLTEDQGVNYIRPIFQRGPRDRATTIWVCAVNPVIFDKIIHCGHVYISKSRCKVVEFYDYNQCPKCLKFSHQAEDCYGKVTCAHCGEEGHHRDVCMKLQEEPKCSNCKGRHRATSKWCPKRRTGH